MSNEFFSVVGSQPALGRTFTDAEQHPGAADVAVLTDACWASQFGRDPSVLGKTLLLDERPHTVIGVMPQAFAFPELSAPVDVIVTAGTERGPPRSGGELLGDRPRAARSRSEQRTSGPGSRLRSIAARTS